MLFAYEALKGFVREDFERFYAMGFDGNQILPAVLHEYEHGEGFCQAENICIRLFLVLNYWEKGLPAAALMETLVPLLADERCEGIQAALGSGYAQYVSDLDVIQNLAQQVGISLKSEITQKE